MRTITAQIVTDETDIVVGPRHTFTSYNDLISFALLTTQTNASLETGVPQTFATRLGGTYAYAAYRYTDGTSKLQVVTLATVANWALNGGGQINANTILVMRNGVFTDNAGDTWLYSAVASGSAIQLKRQQIDGITTNPPTVSLTNWGITFGQVLNDSPTVVRRVEAICPTNNGVVVAVGTHRFDTDLSTILFYWLPDSTHAYQLNAIIQCPLTETYTNWYSAAKWATYISATYNPDTNKIWVVANDHVSGRAVTFSVCSGIESHVTPIIPIDPDVASTTFRASAIAHVGALYYLCGRYTQTFEDGTSLAFDCYLTSADGECWSFGERNSFLTSSDVGGKFLYDGGASPPLYYYGGNLLAYSANASYIDGDTTRLTTLTPVSWTLDQITNGADALNATVDNSEGALDDNPNLKRGSSILFQSGQWGNQSNVGVYGVDSVSGSVIPDGRESVVAGARDLGSKTIMEHNSPLDVDLWGCDHVESILDTLDSFTVKTPNDSILQLDPKKPTTDNPADYDVVVDSTSKLVSKALNNPLVAYADTVDARDGIAKATVKFTDTGDTYHLSVFGFVFAGDSAFNAVLVPKANDWGGKVRPRVVKSSLQPYVPATDTGGFKITQRESNIWVADASMEGSYNPITDEAASHYVTEGSWVAAEGSTYDLALRKVGRRVQLMIKLHDYAAATMASNATYSTVMEYTYSDDEACYQPAGQNHFGLIAETDVWADKTAFEHGAYGDQELSLTSAVTSDIAGRYGTAATPTGVTQWDTDGGAGLNAEAYNGASLYTGDLRNYFYIGQTIRTFGAAVNIYRTIANISDPHVGGQFNRITFTSGANPAVGLGACSLWIKSGDAWAEASSAQAGKAIQNSSTVLWLENKPIKTVKAMLGWGLFTGNNPADILYWPAWVQSDGVTHYLLDKGWDAGTNPTGEASSWKLIFHHNAVGQFLASTAKGLPSSGRMFIYDSGKQESVRYNEGTITLWGENLVNPGYGRTMDLTYIPTIYAIPLTQFASTTIKNYTAGLYPTVQDDLGPTHFSSALGMLFEVTGRSAGGASSDVPNVYVTGNGNDGGDGDRGYVTIDTMPAGSILDSDMVIISGRGQLGTKKTTHASDAVVGYYPAPISATTLLTSLITVTRFNCYTGAYRCVEDNLKYLCALAGVRSFTGRNYHTLATVKTPYTLALTTTPQALPLAADVSDFTLDMNVAVVAAARLQVDFRGYYRLTIKQPSAGTIEIGLQAPSDGTITGGGSGSLKWLEVSPAMSIGNGNDYCPANANVVPVRISVQGPRIQVDVAGQLAWVFNLDAMVHTNGTSYDIRTAGGILVSYASAVSGNSCSFRVLEMGNEDRNVLLPMGDSASNKIRELCDRWHIKSRAKADGGLEFGRFKVRDDGGSFPVNVFRDDWQWTDTEVAGHFQVSGKAKAGATLDAAWIAAEGYRFASSLSDADLSNDGAGVTAASALREIQEYSEQRKINGWGLVELQPEDKIALAYDVAASTGAPDHASTSHVISAITLRADTPDETQADYTLRKYIA